MEVAAGVLRFQLPMPFELRHVNVYLLRDADGFTLIDTGLRTDESRNTLHTALRQAGVAMPRIRRILVTHIHPDHFGLAAELRDQSGGELVIHRLEVSLMEPRYARAEDLVQDVGHWLALSGVPAEEAEYLKSASLGAREFVAVVEPDLMLEGAERLSLDGGELLVVWTPGHSPGHCCFYLPDRKVLFSGDHLLPKISPNIGLHPQSSPDPLDDYLQALERVAALDVQLVLPAHGDPFRDHRARAAEIREHHQIRKDALLALATQPTSGWDLAIGLFHGVMERNVFQKRLALQETLAHCQSLAQDGRLRKLATSSAVRWVRA